MTCGLAGVCAGNGGGHRDGNQLFGEAAGGLRGEGFLVAGEGEGVLIFAGDVVLAGDALGGEAHGEQRGRIVLGEPGIGAGLDAAHGDQAHGFGAAGDDDAAPPERMRMIGLRDGLKAGGAEAVDGDAGNLDGQAGAESGQAGDVPALLALGLRAAEDHVVDFGSIQAGNLVQSPAEGECGEIVGAGGGERAFGGAANGGANGADENGFRHRCSSLFDICRRP